MAWSIPIYSQSDDCMAKNKDVSPQPLLLIGYKKGSIIATHFTWPQEGFTIVTSFATSFSFSFKPIFNKSPPWLKDYHNYFHVALLHAH